MKKWTKSRLDELLSKSPYGVWNWSYEKSVEFKLSVAAAKSRKEGTKQFDNWCDIVSSYYF